MYEVNLIPQSYEGTNLYYQQNFLNNIIPSRKMSYQEHKKIKYATQQKIDFFDFAFDKIRTGMKAEYYNKQLIHVLSLVKEYCNLNYIPEPCIIDLDSRFIYGFVAFLTAEKKLMTNTIKGYIQKTTYFITLARQEGLQVADDYKLPRIEEEETSGIYLTERELSRLYSYPLKTKLKEEVRDLFVLGCCTGLRYSDYSTLSLINFDFQDRLIRKKTKKTGQPAVIPLHEYVEEIIEKYNGLPKSRCSQWFNKAIKNICRDAGINKKIYWERTVGGKVICKTFKKYELVSSHTARRTFATNMYTSGIPLADIRVFTAHKTESSLLKYIRFSMENVANKYKNNKFFRQ